MPAPHRLRGEHDVQLACEQARVVVERLVEIADAEEEDGIGVSALDVEILLAEWGGRRHLSKSAARMSSTEVSARWRRLQLLEAEDGCDAAYLVEGAGAREAQLPLGAVGVALAVHDEEGAASAACRRRA